MKKLYRKTTAVHPVSDHLAFLPAAILTLAVALSPADREVLAYLISHSACNQRNTQNAPEKYKKDHSPVFSCDCFRCYMSYWVRWDTSANRRVIHDIIDAYEDDLDKKGKGKSRRERKRRGRVTESTQSQLIEPDSVVGSSSDSYSGCVEVEAYGSGGGGDDVAGEGCEEKGSVRKFVSYIGERFWGAWT